MQLQKNQRKNKFTNNGTLSLTRRENQLRSDAKRRYGLTLEKARELRKGICEICQQHAKKMVIDHNIPKTYRGILCQQCNTRLGWFESKKDKIISYLNK